jgi:hypothetical protein
VKESAAATIAARKDLEPRIGRDIHQLTGVRFFQRVMTPAPPLVGVGFGVGDGEGGGLTGSAGFSTGFGGSTFATGCGFSAGACA